MWKVSRDGAGIRQTDILRIEIYPELVRTGY